MNKGTYLLLIKILNDEKILIKKKELLIKSGLYCYVGSAMKNLHQRVGRHISYNEGKYKKHWHIDNLLEIGEVLNVNIFPDGVYREEELSYLLNDSFDSIKDFGASDCKSNSHLFIINDLSKYYELISSYIKKSEDI